MSASDEMIVVAPQVRSRVLDGEAVLLHLRTGTYFGANEVGSRIWQLVVEGSTRAGLIERIAQEFDVDRDTLERDVDLFLEELLRAGLIAPSSPAPGR
jgi:hypothetical protein